MLDKLSQGPSTLRPPFVDTTYTSGEDTDKSQPRRRVRSKRTFKMKKSHATDKVAQFFVTGPTDASIKLSEFCYRICQKDVSVLTHSSSEILWNFQGIRHFARDQRLRIETPRLRVIGFDGKPLTEDKLERQHDKILRCSLSCLREREREGESSRFEKTRFRVLAETLVPNFLCWRKFHLVDVLLLGGSCELIERLWERFVLTASPVNVTVA